MHCRKTLPKIAFTTTLSQEQFAALEHRAAQDNITRSQVIGTAVNLYLAEELARADQIMAAIAQERKENLKSKLTKLQAVEHK